jgi:SAM-dependent methyltransferase
MTRQIDDRYTRFYAERKSVLVYPVEMVVRMFLAKYPYLDLDKKRYLGARVLDLGFGDGRNTIFLCQQGFDVYGTEITAEIVSLTSQRLAALRLQAGLFVGRNSALPFEDEFFDYVLACHSCYYVDEEDQFDDNLREIRRTLKPGGHLLASVPFPGNYLLRNGVSLPDGCIRVTSDPYGSRNGCKVRGFLSNQEIERIWSPFFERFTFGSLRADYFGLEEHVCWVVCRRPL